MNGLFDHLLHDQVSRFKIHYDYYNRGGLGEPWRSRGQNSGMRELCFIPRGGGGGGGVTALTFNKSSHIQKVYPDLFNKMLLKIYKILYFTTTLFHALFRSAEMDPFSVRTSENRSLDLGNFSQKQPLIEPHTY